jgi:hypothetical protein
MRYRMINQKTASGRAKKGCARGQNGLVQGSILGSGIIPMAGPPLAIVVFYIYG